MNTDRCSWVPAFAGTTSNVCLTAEQLPIHVLAGNLTSRSFSIFGDRVSAFANWPISRKLMAAFAAVVAVIAVSSAIVYSRLHVMESAKDRRVHTTEVLETLQTADEAMLEQQTAVRGYFITGQERFLQHYHKGTDSFTAAIRKARELTSDNPAQQIRLDELNELAAKWRSEVAQRVIALIATPATREDARAVVASQPATAAMDRVRAKVDEIAGVERDLLAQRSALETHAYATAYAMTIIGGAASLIVALLMGVLLTRGITVPITRMTSAMAALAKGDTTVTAPGLGRGDEIGAMAASVEVFKQSIIERQTAQAELAHVNRVATMGQLTASIAHEVNQPIAATVTNAQAALRWLNRQPPDLDEVREALAYIAEDGKRAGEVIAGIRELMKKAPPRKDRVEINGAIREVIELTRSEAVKNGISVQTELAAGLPLIQGDRVQLQQVMLNLIVNAVEATSGVSEGSRELLITTRKAETGGVRVAVRDTGPGLTPAALEHLFEPFYTTKPNGLGLGLSICRSIIEAHGGRLWTSANVPRGAVFQFTLPEHPDMRS
jgi:C4-dicarboxylate-specific signal transduction histidine kinase